MGPAATAVDTKDPAAVRRHLVAVFTELGWSSSAPLLDRALTGVVGLFRGDDLGYQAIDMHYHNLEHTLQATVCSLAIFRGRHVAGVEPALAQRDAELLVIAALLHDSGYLKERGDPVGTGAKYTFVHERRSCDFARRFLPALGLADGEIDDVCAGISCTGPRSRISTQPFRRPAARLLACMLVTADYLGQMGAPNYPDSLDHLFHEFREAFDHEGVPAERRPYRTADDLKSGTALFWEKVVRPMLDSEADGVHRFLLTGQTNPYLQAIEANIAEIGRRQRQGAVGA